MMRIANVFGLLVAGLPLFGIMGCSSDAQDACGPTDACTAAGAADLVVKQVSVVGGFIDSETGRPVIAPDAIDVKIVVVNEGGERSETKPMLIRLGDKDMLLLNVPALDASQTFTQTVHLTAPPTGSFLIGTDSTNVTATIVAIDADETNNERASIPFLLAMPAIRITTTIDSTVLRANASAPATMRIQNVSRFATLGETTLSYCVYAPERSCNDEPSGIAFGSFVIPSIGAGQTLVLDKPVAIPSSAVDQNRIGSYKIGTCITSGAVKLEDVVRLSTCSTAAQVVLTPDYEACNPVALAPGVPASASAVCRTPCDIEVFSVDVQAGHTYFLQTDDGQDDITLRWRTRYRDDPVDASLDPGFQPVVSQKVYAVTAPKYCGIVAGAHDVVLRDNF